ncbi:uncharacterized protein LOC130778066 [Actinidia eriantha]|uniref:uncharacterized protein LOC130778066 n=1 Tax=Actinidia eriantha TaxID=165200 RepID=UPI00258D17D3|nr:uncharacterized protein LOC130778066 [Actinidia eriantha]
MAHEGGRREKYIISFFKSKVDIAKNNAHSPSNIGTSIPNEESPSKSQRVEFDDTNLERDPRLRIPIWQYPINQRDELSHPTFVSDGFRNWKRVNDGTRCILLNHVGGPTLPHNNAVQSVEGLRNVARHIDKVINAQTSEEIQKNMLRLKATIESVRWLSLQACTFRGHDESLDSNNPGNLIAMIKLMGKLNVDIDNVVLEKAPKNANLVDMYGATIKVLQTIVEEGSSNSIRGEAGVCTQYDIEMPMMDARYKEFTGRSCQQRDHITMEHHYRVDIFNAVIDFQLGELNNRFNEGTMELLILSSALEPKDGFKSLDIYKICTLADKFYPGDFTNQEMHYLRCQLEYYKLDVPQHEKF